MTTVLPPIPRYVLTIFEPISLIAGAIAPLIAPRTFIPSQLPPNLLNSAQLADNYPLLLTEHVLALQLGNLYFLLMMVGVGVLNTTTEPRVVHAYVIALAVADLGHIAASGWGMGLDALLNVSGWNATQWGNIAATIFLFLTRMGYLSGLLGEDQVPGDTGKGRKAKRTRID